MIRQNLIKLQGNTISYPQILFPTALPTTGHGRAAQLGALASEAQTKGPISEFGPGGTGR
jgi:hypothetical protein